MSNPATAQWPRTIPRLDSQDPYLRILFITIFVRDLERSIQFYVGQLGFNLLFDSRVGTGRFVVVGPPDGSATLSLAEVTPGAKEYESIGRSPTIVFLSENVVAKYEQWRDRGVHFSEPPHKPVWGGLYASLEDPDGNSLKLVESDDLSRNLDRERKSLAEKIAQERHQLRNWSSLNRYRRDCSRKYFRNWSPLNMPAPAYRLAKWEATITTSSVLARNDSGLSWETFRERACRPRC